MKRTNLQLATSLRSNLPEKVATRNVFLTMSTKNKITKGRMFSCTKAARTKPYVHVGSCKNLLLAFILKHYNKKNSNELRTAKTLKKV